MDKEILGTLGAIAEQRNLSQEVMVAAMEQAFCAAVKKVCNVENIQFWDIRVDHQVDAGIYKVYRRWLVTEAEDESFDEHTMLSKEQAAKTYPDVNLGEMVEEFALDVSQKQMTSRVAASTLKQVFHQKLNEAQRESVRDTMAKHIGQLVNGVIVRTNRDFYTVEIASPQAEVIMKKPEAMKPFQIGDRIKACISSATGEGASSQVQLSRTSNEMLVELMRLEVPEVAEQLVEVRSVAREPGQRSKIAVMTNDGRIDPVGACVGIRGSRISAVSEELSQERIDVIKWDADPAQMVINIFAPLEVKSIMLDEDRKVMDVAMEESALALAIGRNGQNVRLASELVGWRINVMSETNLEEKQSTEKSTMLSALVASLEIDEDVAEALFDAGFQSVEQIAYVGADDETLLEMFDAETIAVLQQCAQNALMLKALSDEGSVKEPQEDLLSLEGMDRATAFRLADQGVYRRDDLADLSIDELLDIENMNRKKAERLIMNAREHWFSENE